MSAREEKAAQALEAIAADFDLDVERVGRHLASEASTPSITFPRLRMIVDEAESHLKSKSRNSKKGSIDSRAEALIAQARSASGATLSSLLNKHGSEDEKCDICDWISSQAQSEWLDAENWIYEALIQNSNSPDALLSKMLMTFESAPGAWGIAAEIEHHPNASTKTIDRALNYLSGPEWD